MNGATQFVVVDARELLWPCREAAAELFYRHGYQATSIRQIAAEIGVLSGSLYAHIESKERLLRRHRRGDRR